MPPSITQLTWSASGGGARRRDPEALTELVAAARRFLPRLAVFGGCCGSDHRHVGAMDKALASAAG